MTILKPRRHLHLVFLAVLLAGLSSVSNAQNTCEFNGITYARGETLSFFQTRCGLPDDYPCVCNPDARGQIDCPFCSFATNTPNLVRCARDGETVSFRDINNVGQTCTCDTSTDPSNPTSSCQVDMNAGQTCRISLPDGSFVTRNVGEEIGRASRCGATSEYPCFCNPNLPGQIECPYCSFAAPDERLICLADGETKTFIDLTGAGRTCTCFPGESPAFPMEFECTDAPTRVPIEPGAQCTYTRPDGSMFSVDHGASLGSSFTSRCGDPVQWPCFCNVQLDNQIDCPYCAVPDPNSAGFLCAAHDEILRNVPQDDNSLSDCLCQIISPFEEPVLDCGDFPTQVPVTTCSINLPNGQTQIFDAGDEIPIGLTTAGPCGEDFPYICNPELLGASDLEYPYCEFPTPNDSAPGNNGGGGSMKAAVCGRDGSSITFANSNGVDQTCTCEYINANIGATVSCVVAPPPPTATNSPNMGPNEPQPSPRPTVAVTAQPVTPPTVETTGSGGTVTRTSILANILGVGSLVVVMMMSMVF